MVRSIAWLHVGDLHIEAADQWQSLEHLRKIVGIANTELNALDFIFIPGDNANNGRPEEYRAMLDVLDGLRLPWRTLPGDHDYKDGTLDSYLAAIPEQCRPFEEIIADYRCLFLDIVSGGQGGPDFRFTREERARLKVALREQTPSLVFMHAFPGDLHKADAAIAKRFAPAGVAFVDTGHTHYNELLNDGVVVYGATRSTGQIEEDGGQPGYTLVCVHDGVCSWRFRRLDAAWPALQIVSPSDLRLATRVSDEKHVCRPGKIEIVVRSFGRVAAPVWLQADDDSPHAMAERDGGYWHGAVRIDAPGLHRIAVGSASSSDAIDILVRGADALPKRSAAILHGHAAHSVGAWPEAGILGTRLGPNCNGQDW